MNRWLAVSLGFCTTACATDQLEPTQPPGVPIPAAIQLVSGNNQEGKTYFWLAEPFRVRTTDASGTPVPWVAVTWQIASGEGVFQVGAQEAGPQATTRTNHAGEAEIWFRPHTLGGHFVEASAASVPSVSFTVAVTTQVLHWWGAFPRDVEVPIGMAVEWAPWDEAPVRIRSIEVPPSGESFDTGSYTAANFRFVPSVTGTWSYVVEYRDSASDGAIHTLTVR